MKFKNSNGEWQTIKVKNYGIEQTPIGSMIYYPSQNIPAGYLVCDGREVLIADYPLLFNVIGYIGGDNVATGYFRLPDMQGIVPAGYCAEIDNSSPLSGDFGETVGDSTHTLTIDEMPSHQHELSLTDYGTDHCSAVKWETTTTGGKFKYSYDMLQPTGGNQPHPIVQPTKLYHWLIKAKNVLTLGGQTEDFEVDGHLSAKTLGIKHLPEIADCNDTNLETGFYYCTGNTNNTPHNSAWFLEVKRKEFDDGDLVITQTAYRYRDNEMWIRHYNSLEPAGWKEWSPLVVGQNTSDGQKGCIKFANGTMLCYGRTYITVTIGGTWGNIYSSGGFNPGISFPEKFKHVISCNAQYIYHSYTAWIGDLGYTESGISNIQFFRATAAPSATYCLAWQAFGTWK